MTDVGKMLLEQLSIEDFKAAVREALGKAGLVEFYPEQMVQGLYSDPRLKKYHVNTLIGKVKSYCLASRKQTELERVPCVFLGGRDFFTRKLTGWQQIRSQRITALTEDGKLMEMSTFGGAIGDRGHEVDVNQLHGKQVVVRGELTEWETAARKGQTWQARYVEGVPQTEIPVETLIKRLLPLAEKPEGLTEDDKYRLVVLRAPIRQFGPEAMWVSTGNKVALTNPDGTQAFDNKGNALFRDERIKEGERPLVSARFGEPQESVFEFNLVLESSEESRNRVRVQFRNQRFGMPYLRLLDGKQVFEDAAKMSGETREEDPFAYLTAIYQGQEVLVIGTVTQWNSTDAVDWINVQGSAVIQLEGGEGVSTISAPPPVLKPAVTAESVPSPYEGIIIGEATPATPPPVATPPQPTVTGAAPKLASAAEAQITVTPQGVQDQMTARLGELNTLVQERIKIFQGMDAKGLYNAGVFAGFPWFDIKTYESIVNDMIAGKWKGVVAKPEQPPKPKPEKGIGISSLHDGLLRYIKRKDIDAKGGASFDELVKWAAADHSVEDVEQALIDLLSEGAIYEPNIHQYKAA